MSSILTVSQLNRYLAFKVKSDVKLKGVALKGELSNYTVNLRSGHAYFSVKDEAAVIRGIMFSSNVGRLKFEPVNGMDVLVVGDVSVYERDGILQIAATEIRPMGAGTISLGLDQLKKKLAEKGVFDAAKKKRIPVLPKKIAVVTSATGAALQDIRNVLSRRCPIVRVEVFPCQVQGDAAPDTISRALAMADRSGADTVILARGGGSDEDLMAFNSAAVAMAVFECETPVISAVGHETDTSLADYAADLRAPTPSAAAELAVPVMGELIGAVEHLRQRMARAVSDRLVRAERDVTQLGSRLALSSPERRLTAEEGRVNGLESRLGQLMKSRIDRGISEVDKYAAQLTALGPFNILDRGYSITMKNGSAVGAGQLSAGDSINILFADGTALAEVKQVNENDI